MGSKMAEELQSLLEKIQNDGIKKAEAERDAIIAQAQAEAADIIKAAEEKAKALRDAAEADADRFTVKQLVGMADVTSETLRLLDSNVNVGGAQLMWLEAMARKSTKQM